MPAGAGGAIPLLLESMSGYGGRGATAGTRAFFTKKNAGTLCEGK